MSNSIFDQAKEINRLAMEEIANKAICRQCGALCIDRFCSPACREEFRMEIQIAMRTEGNKNG